MEINYSTILKYLGTKDPKLEFITKKNLMTNSSNFPDKFKDMLDSKFYRYGVSQTDMANNNISFFTSFLTLINDEFISSLPSEEYETINKLIDSLDCEYPDSLKSFPKNIIKKSIKEKEVSVFLFELLVNKFNVNFIILDFKNSDVYTAFKDNCMNPWKPILLFAMYDKIWEPIMTSEKKTFSYNDNFIKKLLNGSFDFDIKYYEGSAINKTFSLVDNIKEIIDNLIVDNNNTTESEKEITVLPNKTKLNRMTKQEILNLIDKLQINNSNINNKTTKKDLIEILLSNN
jgi:hypothetical protein